MDIKFIFKIYLIFGITFSYSQTYQDVLRYNSYNHEGTSRFNSMGGAFGALGGDLSSISIIEESKFLNLFGYISGIMPSMIKINAKTVATVSKVVIL